MNPAQHRGHMLRDPSTYYRHTITCGACNSANPWWRALGGEPATNTKAVQTWLEHVDAEFREHMANAHGVHP